MPTDLDNALLYVETLLTRSWPRENLAALRRVIDAARLVADPNKKAARLTAFRQRHRFVAGYFDDVADEIVAVALTPGDTEHTPAQVFYDTGERRQ